MFILSPCLENTIVSVNFKNILGVLEWTEDLCKRKHLQFTQRLVTLFIKSLSLLFSAIIHHSVFHQVSPAFRSLNHSSDLSWPVCAVTLPLYMSLYIWGFILSCLAFSSYQNSACIILLSVQGFLCDNVPSKLFSSITPLLCFDLCVWTTLLDSVPDCPHTSKTMLFISFVFILFPFFI